MSEIGLDEAVQKLEAELAKPIPGQVRVTQEDANDELALFRRAMSG